jgi:hypothetical protein
LRKSDGRSDRTQEFEMFQLGSFQSTNIVDAHRMGIKSPACEPELASTRDEWGDLGEELWIYSAQNVDDQR